MKPQKTKITAVIFDLGKVLINYSTHRAARAFSRVCHVPLLKIWMYFFTSSIEHDYTCGKISSREFYREASRALKLDLSYRKFEALWNDIFWENKGMRGLLSRLKRKGYPLYLISNTNHMHFEYLKKRYKILKSFDETFPSHEVGHRKPDLRIYQKVLRKIRRRPGETVFIDDVPAFVRGAKKAGMHAIRFRNPGQLVRDLHKLEVKF